MSESLPVSEIADKLPKLDPELVKEMRAAGAVEPLLFDFKLRDKVVKINFQRVQQLFNATEQFLNTQVKHFSDCYDEVAEQFAMLEKKVLAIEADNQKLRQQMVEVLGKVNGKDGLGRFDIKELKDRVVKCTMQVPPTSPANTTN